MCREWVFSQRKIAFVAIEWRQRIHDFHFPGNVEIAIGIVINRITLNRRLSRRDCAVPCIGRVALSLSQHRVEAEAANLNILQNLCNTNGMDYRIYDFHSINIYLKKSMKNMYFFFNITCCASGARLWFDTALIRCKSNRVSRKWKKV